MIKLKILGMWLFRTDGVKYSNRYILSHKIPFQPCCLNDLIADLTEELSELATASGIHLTSRVPPDEIYVLGNESQLYRLVSNLIANAIQYISIGGSVKVSLSQSDRYAVMAIEDTGMGISLTEQSRIFERFYRVNSDSLSSSRSFISSFRNDSRQLSSRTSRTNSVKK